MSLSVPATRAMLWQGFVPPFVMPRSIIPGCEGLSQTPSGAILATPSSPER